MLVAAGRAPALAAREAELAAVGMARRGDWPSERSVLVLSLELESDAASGLAALLGFEVRHLGEGELVYTGLELGADADEEEDIVYPPPHGLDGAAAGGELEAALSGFAAALAAGTAPRRERSQPAPKAEAAEGEVQVVVRSTFDALVRAEGVRRRALFHTGLLDDFWRRLRSHIRRALLSQVDVFLMVHAPWCAECQALKPALKALAHRFRGIPTVRVTSMDGTANEVEGLQVDAFPALILFAANKRPYPMALAIDGMAATLSVEMMALFVRQHAALPESRRAGLELPPAGLAPPREGEGRGVEAQREPWRVRVGETAESAGGGRGGSRRRRAIFMYSGVILFDARPPEN